VAWLGIGFGLVVEGVPFGVVASCLVKLVNKLVVVGIANEVLGFCFGTIASMALVVSFLGYSSLAFGSLDVTSIVVLPSMDFEVCYLEVSCFTSC
jgi:hypothetical protein